ncbi:gas vesicle protein GvpO [Halocatena pleomorpha]|uniref:Gas vesicle protein n=1 Tax=Halocatena pleomorpha TaxID=1785090 RepID=A0A3P3RF73_9EURY|nr:gas vesicle protein GvpO [Halocatena pleomorpha]RRJ31568.1 gas vesicle protein [Halocatena pleomorpha]
MEEQDVTPEAYTVDELSDEIESIDDPATLKEMYDAETEQQNRTGAKEAIEARLEELDADANTKAESIEETRDAIERSLESIDGTEDTSGDSDEAVRGSIGEIQAHVRDRLPELIDQPLDSIIEVDRDEEGWRVIVECIERRSVPDTQDILGRYEIRLGADGQIHRYRRRNRYRRDDTSPVE